MDYTVTRNAGSMVIAMSGRLTFSDTQLFPKVVSEIQKADRGGCVFDLKDLTYIDSSGMSLFVHAYDAAREKSVELAIHSARGMVLEALNRAGFPKLLRMVP